MKEQWQIMATNAQGEINVEIFTDGKKADVRSKQLYNEVDDKGLYRWGTIRVQNLNYLQTGGKLEDTVHRGASRKLQEAV